MNLRTYGHTFQGRSHQRINVKSDGEWGSMRTSENWHGMEGKAPVSKRKDHIQVWSDTYKSQKKAEKYQVYALNYSGYKVKNWGTRIWSLGYNWGGQISSNGARQRVAEMDAATYRKNNTKAQLCGEHLPSPTRCSLGGQTNLQTFVCCAEALGAFSTLANAKEWIRVDAEIHTGRKWTHSPSQRAGSDCSFIRP